MKRLLPVLFLFCLACQHADRQRHNHVDANHFQAGRDYKPEHHLFLNYYFGMTISEYEKATKLNFLHNKLLLSGEMQECELNRYGAHHTREDVENISRHSTVFYEFALDGEEFEAVVHPVFRYNRLVKIELQTLNCFDFGNHKHEFYRRKINRTHEVLVNHHENQFGKYLAMIKPQTENEKTVAQNAGADVRQFDLRKYIFNQDNKIVTIETKCCDFKPVVTYTHKFYYDFQREKSTENEVRLERELYHYWSEGES